MRFVRPESKRSPVLLIAYGNTLRGDDGIAWHAADELEKKFSTEQVMILRRHQLTPELAEDMSRHAVVIFVDAASPEAGTPGEVNVAQLPAENSESPGRFSHQLSPATLVAMAAELYQAKTMSFSITVTGENFEHGEELSASVAASLPALVAKLETLIGEFL